MSNMFDKSRKRAVHKKAANHPGFKNVEDKISATEGVPEKTAGAILAASNRDASPEAKQANPRLNKIGGA